MALVLDASAAASWFLEDEESLFAASLSNRAEKGEEIYVPSYWIVEVVNALLKAERRERSDGSSLNKAVAFLYAMRLAVQPSLTASKLGPVLVLCRRHRLSAYDGVYLSLALDLALPLATRDDALVRACRAEGVELVQA